MKNKSHLFWKRGVFQFQDNLTTWPIFNHVF
jgi:hypothetical protein